MIKEEETGWDDYDSENEEEEKEAKHETEEVEGNGEDLLLDTEREALQHQENGDEDMIDPNPDVMEDSWASFKQHDVPTPLKPHKEHAPHVQHVAPAFMSRGPIDDMVLHYIQTSRPAITVPIKPVTRKDGNLVFGGRRMLTRINEDADDGLEVKISRDWIDFATFVGRFHNAEEKRLAGLAAALPALAAVCSLGSRPHS